MGSLPIGLLSSNLVELGDFDQCLAVDGQFEQVNFVGKYCLATVNLPRKPYQPVIYNASVLGTSKWKVDAVELWHILDNKFSISMGVCFPSICQEKEVRAVMRSCKYKNFEKNKNSFLTMSSLSFRLQNFAVARIQRHLLPVKRRATAVQSKDLGCSVRQKKYFLSVFSKIPPLYLSFQNNPRHSHHSSVPFSGRRPSSSALL